MTKTTIYNRILKDLEDKLSETTNSLNSLEESRNSDTKSSAGDKHETGRAMIQIEIDQTGKQLAQLQELHHVMLHIDPSISSSIVRPGSLVTTTTGKYYIAIAFGKLMLDGEKVFVISPASPIGQLLLGKSAGIEIQYNGNGQTILTVE